MNTNCLDGVACPSCGSDHQFLIRAACTATVTDSGILDTSDIEWDDSARAECSNCGRTGALASFT